MAYNFLNISESEYRALDALSYSLLTSEYFKHSDEVIPAFAIGSYTDSLAFNQPLDQFVIENPAIEVPKSTTNIYKFVNDLIHTRGVHNLGSGIVAPEISRLMRESYDFVGIKKPAFEGFSDLFFRNSVDYFNFTVRSIGKTFISAEDDMLAHSMVNALRNHEYTAKYFSTDGKNDIENLFQVPLMAKINGIEMKALLDIVHINHANKTITPIDLKTTGKDTRYFASSFVKYKYYIQAALYRLLLEYFVSKCDELKGYKVMPFKFIPITKNAQRMVPVVITVNDNLHNTIISGGTFKYYLKPFKGLYDLIAEYIEFQSLDQGEGYTVEVMNNKGEVELDL